jgi:hypothetical protein
VTIYLDDKRWVAADLLSKLQHLSSGVPMLMIGVGKLADEAERPMAALEIAVALGVFVTFAMEVYAAKNHSASHSPVGWFDLAAGILLIFEAFHGHHVKPGYLRPPFFAGIVTLVLGLLHGRFHAFKKRRRYLKLDESGLEIRASRFRRISLAWADLASVDLAGSKAIFHGNDGRRHTFRLNLLNNRDEVRKGIAEHARAAGVRSETIS